MCIKLQLVSLPGCKKLQCCSQESGHTLSTEIPDYLPKKQPEWVNIPWTRRWTQPLQQAIGKHFLQVCKSHSKGAAPKIQ